MEREKGNAKWRRRRRRRGAPKERLDEEELSPIIDGSCSATVANVHRQSIGGEEKGDEKKKKKGHTTGNDVKGFRYGVARECRKTAVAGRMSYTEVFTSHFFFFSFDTPKKRHISHRGWALVLRRAINRYPRPRKTAGRIYISSSLFLLLLLCYRHTHTNGTQGNNFDLKLFPSFLFLLLLLLFCFSLLEKTNKNKRRMKEKRGNHL